MKLIGYSFIWLILWVGLGIIFRDFHIIENPAWWAFYGAVMAVIALLLFINLDKLPPRPKKEDPYKCPACGSNLAYVGAPCVNSTCSECFTGFVVDGQKQEENNGLQKR